MTIGARSTLRSASSATTPRPCRGRVADAADQLQVAERRSGRPGATRASSSAPAIPSSTTRPPSRTSRVASSTAGPLPRSRSRGRARRAAAHAPRRRRPRLRRGGERKLQLLFADPVGDDPRRARRAARERSRATRACRRRRLRRSPPPPGGRARAPAARLTPGSTSTPVSNATCPGSRWTTTRSGATHELAVSAAPRETELVVVLAEVRIPGPAAAAPPTPDDSLAHDAIADSEALTLVPTSGDLPAPFVARERTGSAPSAGRAPRAAPRDPSGTLRPRDYERSRRPDRKAAPRPPATRPRRAARSPPPSRGLVGLRALFRRGPPAACATGWNSTSSRSIRLPSISITVKRRPSCSTVSPSCGA